MVKDLFHLILGGGVGLLLQQVVSLGHAPRVWFAHGGAVKVEAKDFEAASYALEIPWWFDTRFKQFLFGSYLCLPNSARAGENWAEMACQWANWWNF